MTEEAALKEGASKEMDLELASKREVVGEEGYRSEKVGAGTELCKASPGSREPRGLGAW